MEIKTNKTYYRVKCNYATESCNYRTIHEYATYDEAVKLFDSLKEIYLKRTKEEQTKFTYFLCEVVNGDEDVIAYFGMGLAFNERPVWVSYRFRNHQKGV